MRHNNIYSVLLYNTGCPRCKEMGNDRAGDNLAIYSDGHEYCFACRYYRSTNGLSSLRSNSNVTPIKRTIQLPEDSNTEYSQASLAWLAKYESNKAVALRNGFLFSESGVAFKDTQADNLLLFPLWDKDNLQGYQARYFGHNPKIPKYVGRGKLDSVYHFLFNGAPCDNLTHSNIIVICEDIISSIKVSQAGVIALPLFGNNFTNRIELLKKLTTKKHKLLLWLDPDMTIKSIKEASIARLHGLECYSVHSKYDPKEHSLPEIKKYLNVH